MTEYRDLIHSPAELSRGYIDWAERMQESPGIRWGIPEIDRHVIPLHPGDLMCILGRQASGKTSLLAYFARREAARIRSEGKAEEECVVYATWESSAEEITNFLLTGDEYSVSEIAWGRVDLDVARRRAVDLVEEPIWVIGQGIGRPSSIRMTPDVVYRVIESMEDDFGVRPTLMLFDYLQLVPSESARERQEQVTEAPIRIKELALSVGVPAIAAVQAARRVDRYRAKLPEANDAQWSSSIEQTADKMFSLWRPAVTEDTEYVELNEETYEVRETLLLIRMLKQRFAPGRHTWALYFDPAYLRLAELERRGPQGIDF